MKLTIEHIEEQLGGEGLSPRSLADFRVFLAALYSLRAGEMQRILAIKPGIWLNIRGEKNSDKATDREWQATADGQRETQLKWELRRIDKLSAAIATKLRVMADEARNIV
ncbi:MAG: hypothetical protein KF889_01495 [Alphaproteobacteria bacterium]|nr:hypothetical protein [Alphaproteobacteria bacterium]MCW5741577.1 hypothetical protein [Alphaproteobacteria bacterium]